jgi:predicted dehydrogenase
MKKIRYGVVGIKGIGQYHVRSVRENPKFELTALCDTDEQHVRSRAATLGVLPFTSVSELLASRAVDAVSIAVPHHVLALIALECLRAGVHVFVEKPMAIRLSDAQELARVARENNLKLGVGFQYRTFSTSKIIKQVIESGEIGKVQRALWTWHRFCPQTYFAQSPWHAAWESAGGGVLIYHTAHDLDLMRWFFGTPMEVCALLGNQLHDVEVEDIAGAVIRFQSGAQVVLQATTNQIRAHNIRQISGDKGLLVLPDVRSQSEDRPDTILLGTYPKTLHEMGHELHGYMEQPETVWRTLQRLPGCREEKVWRKLNGAMYRLKLKPRPSLLKSGLRAMVDNFADAILHDREPLVTGEDACGTVELFNAITLAAVRGKTISFPLDAAEYDTLFAELCDGKAGVLRSR